MKREEEQLTAPVIVPLEAQLLKHLESNEDGKKKKLGVMLKDLSADSLVRTLIPPVGRGLLL